MQKSTDIRFPKRPLVGALALVGAAIVIVGASKIGGLPASPGLAEASIVESRMLRFADADDGSVRVMDQATGETIAVAEPGTNGFLRGSLRALMRVRKRDGVAFDMPFRLERRSNGQLILIDTAQGVTIDLQAFGQTNAAVFDAFLKPTGGNS